MSVAGVIRPGGYAQKPCPKCGSHLVGFNERWRTPEEIAGAEYRGYVMQCWGGCGYTTNEGTFDEALADWNGQ